MDRVFLVLIVIIAVDATSHYSDHLLKDHESAAYVHASETLRTLLEREEVTDGNCPPQPFPVDLPPTDKLPEEIQNALTALDKLVNSSVNPVMVPGIVMSVTYKGNTLMSKSYGVSSKEGSTIKLNEDTIFRIGSVSKVFAVIMLYQLYEQGHVQSMDDPLVKYAPSFKINNPFSKTDITLRQMASQMSGLPREAPCNTAVGLNICPLDNSQLLEALSNQSLIFPPWTRPSYSNLAYALIGRLLTEALFPTMTYEDYIDKNILQPLGMKSTGFTYTDDVKSRMAVGYLPSGAVAPLTDFGWEGPAGQMYSTINDLNTLAQFFYNSSIEWSANEDSSIYNIVLSPALRREMGLSLFVNPDRQSGFGTPWEVIFYGNYTIRSKGGNVPGYSAMFSYIPELKLSINTLFSGGFDETDFTGKAYQSLLPALVSYLDMHQPPVPYPPNPELYEGSYIAGGISATISTFQGQLLVRLQTTGLLLAYRSPQKMTIFYNPKLAPCLLTQLQAILGEYVYFDLPDSTGKSPGFIIPGFSALLHWKRT